MKKILNKLNRFFELKMGWFFVSPRKAEEWDNYIIKKYNIKRNNKLPF